MILSKMQGHIVGQIARHGTSYNSSGDTFGALLMKADVSQDMPRADYTILAGYNATIHSGQLINGEGRHYIPLKIDRPNAVGADVYKRVYMKMANASGNFQRYRDPVNASTDVWDVPTGTEGTDYGWVNEATGVWVSMDIKAIGDSKTDVGQLEKTSYNVFIPASVNNSYTPVIGDRFVDQNGRKWKLDDVDGFVYQEEAYMARVSPDER